MLLEFVVIPYNIKCEEYAKNLVSLLNKCKNISVSIDTNYDQGINHRQSKSKTDEKNLILLDEICIINDEIIVKYSDKGAKPKRYNKDDFVELLESFNDTTTDDNDNDSDNGSNISDSKCSLM